MYYILVEIGSNGHVLLLLPVGSFGYCFCTNAGKFQVQQQQPGVENFQQYGHAPGAGGGAAAWGGYDMQRAQGHR